MFDAQTIQMQGTTATEQYSPWFPRGGDYGLFTLEVTAVGGGGTPTLTVEMYHKNSSETGDGALAAGNMSFARTTTGRTTVDFANAAGSSPAFGGFEELVRYKFRISGGASSVTTWATFRMLAPIWYDKV
jgi:hypothetical protein